MHIDLQRRNALSRDCRCLAERQALQLQQLNGLALSTRQARQCMPEGGLIVASFLRILRCIAGKGFRQDVDRRLIG